MPLYAFQLIVILSSMTLARRFEKSRLLICIGGDVLALIGSILIRQLPQANRGGRYCGIVLVFAFCNNFPMALSFIASNIGGFTKRSTTSAMFFISYCVGNLVGPQLFKPSEGPTYTVRLLSDHPTYTCADYQAFPDRFHLNTRCFRIQYCAIDSYEVLSRS